MTKRIVSLVLSLIMVFSLFTGLSFTAGAEEAEDSLNGVRPVEHVNDDEPIDTSEDIQIFFIDETESAKAGYKLTEEAAFPAESEEDLAVPDQSTTPFLQEDGSLNSEAGVEGGRAYTDNGVHPYYKIKVNADQEENYIVVGDGNDHFTAFLNFKAQAMTAATGEKYAIYYLYWNNGNLTASAPATDIWPEDQAVETPATCTENGNITYYGLFTTETKVTVLNALGHAWGDWETDPDLPGQKSRTCSRCQETETALNDGYFLIGKVNGVEGWSVSDINPANYFTMFNQAENEYKLETVLADGDYVKAVYVENNQIKYWYPNGENNNFGINADLAGNVSVYLRPNGNGADDWHWHVLYIARDSKLLNLDFTNTVSFDGATNLNYRIDKAALEALGFNIADVEIIVEHHTYNVLTGAHEVNTVKPEYRGTISVSGGVRHSFVYAELDAALLYDDMVAHIEATKDGELYASVARQSNPVDYCFNALERSSDATLKKACADLIVYVSKARTHFQYDGPLPTDDSRWIAGNYGATIATQGNPTLTDDTVVTTVQSTDLVSLATCTVEFSGFISMRLPVKALDSSVKKADLTMVCTYNDYKGDPQTVEVPGSEWANYTSGGNSWRVRFARLCAGEMRQPVTFKIVDKNGNVVSNQLTRSIMGYGALYMQGGSSQTMKDLINAAINYCDSVKAFLLK